MSKDEFEDNFNEEFKKKQEVRLGKLGAASSISPDEIGYSLAKTVLYIVGIYLLIMLIVIIWFDVSKGTFAVVNQENMISDTLNTDYEKVINLYFTEQESKRVFVLDISKIVLLNFLLPIITAIIGYIFGSSKSRKEPDR